MTQIEPMTVYKHEDLEGSFGEYAVRVWRENGLPYLPGFNGILGSTLIEFLQSKHEAKKGRTVYAQGELREGGETPPGLWQNPGRDASSQGTSPVGVPGTQNPFDSRKSA
jgi:hypothetical protein